MNTKPKMFTRKEISARWYRRHTAEAAHRSRSHKLLQLYGITFEDYQDMVSSQHGDCAICGLPTEELHVDHDHESGKVRGLLCKKCNMGIGLLGDSLNVLKKPIQYLEAPPCPS